MDFIEVAIEVTLILYSLSFAWMIESRINFYPNIRRFGSLIWYIQKRLCRTQPEEEISRGSKIVLISWATILFWVMLSLVSIYLLISRIAEINMQPELLNVPFFGLLAFCYLLAPQFVSRSITSLVIWKAREDYDYYNSDKNGQQILCNTFTWYLKNKIDAEEIDMGKRALLSFVGGLFFLFFPMLPIYVSYANSLSPILDGLTKILLSKNFIPFILQFGGISAIGISQFVLIYRARKNYGSVKKAFISFYVFPELVVSNTKKPYEEIKKMKASKIKEHLQKFPLAKMLWDDFWCTLGGFFLTSIGLIIEFL